MFPIQGWVALRFSSAWVIVAVILQVEVGVVVEVVLRLSSGDATAASQLTNLVAPRSPELQPATATLTAARQRPDGCVVVVCLSDDAANCTSHATSTSTSIMSATPSSARQRADGRVDVGGGGVLGDDVTNSNSHSQTATAPSPLLSTSTVRLQPQPASALMDAWTSAVVVCSVMIGRDLWLEQDASHDQSAHEHSLLSILYMHLVLFLAVATTQVFVGMCKIAHKQYKIHYGIVGRYPLCRYPAAGQACTAVFSDQPPQGHNSTCTSWCCFSPSLPPRYSWALTVWYTDQSLRACCVAYTLMYIHIDGVSCCTPLAKAAALRERRHRDRRCGEASRYEKEKKRRNGKEAFDGMLHLPFSSFDP
jgi:hypothetical protein